MTVYVLADIEIHDRDRYDRYGAGFMEIFAKHRGSLLAVDEQPKVVEGDWQRTRLVLLSFPDEAAFDDWYHSTAYQELKAHRIAASDANLLLFRGLERKD